MNDIFNISATQIVNQAMLIQSSLHFIRSDWFYAFIPLFIFLYLAYRTRSNNKIWSGIVDPQLMPYVLNKTGGKQRRYPLILIFIASSLCITALAGPVYKQLSQPVYREQSSLVVLLDLSQSMNAEDVKPSRLARAKLELLDLLNTRKTGQTALVVYAADAFVVTPLTDDNATIANMVPSLTADMMPAQGSNLSNALAKAFSLLSQAGIISGNILVITDDIRQGEAAAIKKVFAQGHRMSILGIGTREGAPIPLDGAFLLDKNGAIVIPRLSPEKLQKFALSGGGLYSSLQADDSDINKLNQLFQSREFASEDDNKQQQADVRADIWQEEGHWLLLPLLLFAALWARKGWLAVQLLFVFTMAMPLTQPAYADTAKPPGEAPGEPPAKSSSNSIFSGNSIDLENLWTRADQKAMQEFTRGNHQKAAKTFTDTDWKASALYRKGDYQAAAELLENSDSSSASYNRGNALAKLGKLDDAIKAYDQALTQDENNADAKHNRAQVKQAIKKQQDQQQQSDNSQDADKQQGESQDDKSQDGEQQDGESQDKQQSEQQDGQQQDGQQQDGQQQDRQQQDGQQQNNQQQDGQQQNTDQQQSQDDTQNAENGENKNQQQQEQQQLEQRDAKAEAEQQALEQQQYQQDQQDQQNKADNKQQSSDNEQQSMQHEETQQQPKEIEINPQEASITEEEQATAQWLKRIPDDPGGLLRRKFHYQYNRIPNQADSEQPW